MKQKKGKTKSTIEKAIELLILILAFFHFWCVFKKSFAKMTVMKSDVAGRQQQTHLHRRSQIQT